MEQNEDTPFDIAPVLAELKRRDLKALIDEHGDSPETRARHARFWDNDPPCPNCGSRAHFEC